MLVGTSCWTNSQSCWWFEPPIIIQIPACKLYHVAADWIQWSGYCNHSWCHHMETFSMLLALCAGNSPVTGEFPSQRPVTWSFDVYFDLRINGWVNNHETGNWRHPHNHYDVTVMYENTNIHPCDVTTLSICCLSNHWPSWLTTADVEIACSPLMHPQLPWQPHACMDQLAIAWPWWWLLPIALSSTHEMFQSLYYSQ